jgi:hypothetical protein
VLRLQLFFSVVVFVVWVFTLVDLAQSPGHRVRTLPKVAWVVVVLLFPVLGSAAWFVLGRPQTARRQPGAYERHAPTFPEYDRPGRAAAIDPEKDDEFLKQVRDRAEAQRKRFAEEKKREAQRREAQEREAQERALEDGPAE